MMAQEKTGVTVWIIGIVFGALAAVIHVLVPEQGLTFLWVMMTTMILGCWKRHAPWRWILLVVPFVPIADIVHKFMRPQQVSRASMWGAVLIALVAVPGAYGGSYMRQMINNIFGKPSR
jgi:hypothetical protein